MRKSFNNVRVQVEFNIFAYCLAAPSLSLKIFRKLLTS